MGVERECRKGGRQERRKEGKKEGRVKIANGLKWIEDFAHTRTCTRTRTHTHVYTHSQKIDSPRQEGEVTCLVIGRARLSGVWWLERDRKELRKKC